MESLASSDKPAADMLLRFKLSARIIGPFANLLVPIAPFLRDSGAQLPLQTFLPSSLVPPSISSIDLPKYPTVVTHVSQPSVGAPDVTPGASQDHIVLTVAIPIDHPSHEQLSEQAPASLTNTNEPTTISDIDMKGKKSAIVAAAGTLLGLATFSELYHKVHFEQTTPPSERTKESEWVIPSDSWVERKACTWFGFCDLSRLNKLRWTTKTKTQQSSAGTEDPKVDLHDFWVSAQNPLDGISGQEENDIPKYVLDHAPLVYLYSGEQYWPCDIDEHLIHTTPNLNYTPIQSADDHPELSDLGNLNKWGRFVYLKSDDNVEDYPEWLGGKINIPNAPNHRDEGDEEKDGDRRGRFEKNNDSKKSNWWRSDAGDIRDKEGVRPAPMPSDLPIPTTTPAGEEFVTDEETRPSELRKRRRSLMGKKVVGGRSDAPAILIVVPKDDGVVDAFWFFFYSYNLGNAVFNVRFGNHVGDWEHTAVRFQNGVPTAVYYSEHAAGAAYVWDAVEKIGKRPVSYSATGTHAMYATPGLHPYILPGGILHDITDRGPLWDPVQNMYSFTYDYQRDHLVPSTLSPNVPVSWFYFAGHWGDKLYPMSDPRQYQFLGQYHYVSGPLGPRFKNLGRQTICIGDGECVLRRWLGDKRLSSIDRYPDVGEGEEMSEEDARRVFGPNYDFVSGKYGTGNVANDR